MTPRQKSSGMTGADFRDIRKALMMTQDEFGEVLGIAENSVARLERDESRISLSRACQAKLLLVTLLPERVCPTCGKKR